MESLKWELHLVLDRITVKYNSIITSTLAIHTAGNLNIQRKSHFSILEINFFVIHCWYFKNEVRFPIVTYFFFIYSKIRLGSRSKIALVEVYLWFNWTESQLDEKRNFSRCWLIVLSYYISDSSGRSKWVFIVWGFHYENSTWLSMSVSGARSNVVPRE